MAATCRSGRTSPIPSRPARDGLTINPSGSIRLTWQATPRNKFASRPKRKTATGCWSLPANYAPEVYPNWVFQHAVVPHRLMAIPVTNRLLLDAKFANHAEGFVDRYPGAWRPVPPGDSRAGTEHGPAVSRQAATAAAHTSSAPRTRRTSCRRRPRASYVTGSHTCSSDSRTTSAPPGRSCSTTSTAFSTRSTTA